MNTFRKIFYNKFSYRTTCRSRNTLTVSPERIYTWSRVWTWFPSLWNSKKYTRKEYINQFIELYRKWRREKTAQFEYNYIIKYCMHNCNEYPLQSNSKYLFSNKLQTQHSSRIVAGVESEKFHRNAIVTSWSTWTKKTSSELTTLFNKVNPNKNLQ